MSIEGALQIALTLDDARIREVAITSTRPLQASRIFHGKAVAAVSVLVPRLFSVCATAQSCAAAQALAAARGQLLSADELVAHRLLMLMETAQEHAWRLCIDGARKVGEAPRLPAAAAARGLLGSLQRALAPRAAAMPELHGAGVVQAIGDLDALLAQEPFGEPAASWCARAGQEARWWRHGTGLAARLLQSLEQEALLDAGDAPTPFLAPLDGAMLDGLLAGPAADEFIAAPTVAGTPQETTSLARQWDDPALAPVREAFGRGLATRFTALLVELARLPQRMRELIHEGNGPGAIAPWSPAPGVGLAQVQAARGLLAHRVELEGETVLRYQILAPTEWNFHPHGVVARTLRGCRVADSDAARKASEWIIHAVDPCVGFEVTLHA